MNLLIRFIIHGGRGLVEDQNFGVHDDGAGERYEGTLLVQVSDDGRMREMPTKYQKAAEGSTEYWEKMSMAVQI